MRKIVLFLLGICLFYGSLTAESITGKWQGVLKVQSIELSIVFHIMEDAGVYSATMDSPDQGAFGILVTQTAFASPNVQLKIDKLGIHYDGTWDLKDTIQGNFTQMGNSLPLVLQRAKNTEEKPNRPQEPQPPFNYGVEEVIFHNARSGLNLAGTFTYPTHTNHFPAVVLITGSGAQNRDEELFGHKPFFVIADYLTQRDIAVLRFDDRGTGGSEGSLSSINTSDLAGDVEAAVTFVKAQKGVDTLNIGLVGHSEGGIIAPMVAAKDPSIAYLVLMAGTGIPGDSVLLKQQDLISAAYGASQAERAESYAINRGAYTLLKRDKATEEVKEELTAYYATKLQNTAYKKNLNEEERALFTEGVVKNLCSPWMRFFLQYDPAPTLSKVTCPVMALNGSKDLQVVAKDNLSAIEEALKKGGNMNATIIEYSGLNHLFQECETGTPLEYGRIEQTISPVVLKDIAEWILQTTE